MKISEEVKDYYPFENEETHVYQFEKIIKSFLNINGRFIEESNAAKFYHS